MTRPALAIAALICSSLVGAQTAPTMRTYTNRTLGLAFDYPAAWNVATTRRDEAKFTLAEGVVVDLFPSSYRQEAEKWQALQVQINRQLERTVERQWEEVILGVPLLMTKLSYEVGGQPTKTLVGLLYTSSVNKLLFRLTAPAASFDTSETQWRAAMQTLRTTTGQLPSAEDPAKPPAIAETPKAPAAPRPLSPKATPRRSAVAPEYVVVQSGGAAVRLHYPRGWTSEAVEGGFNLKHPALVGSVRVAANALLDSPTPDKALTDLAAATLTEFEQVVRRVDGRPRENRAQARINEVRRTGVAKGNPLTVLLAVGLKGDHYWLLTYRGEGAAGEKDRSVLQDLMEQMSVELAP